jgi:hypothetical protein
VEGAAEAAGCLSRAREHDDTTTKTEKLISRCVRGCSQMRVNGMNPSREDKGNRDEKHDRADVEEPSLVPADLDINEGDEEKQEKNNLPPAMPPKV